MMMYIKYACSDDEKIISDSMIMKAILPAFFSSMTGTLLVLMYLFWEKSSTSAFTMLSLIFTYLLIAMTSLTGTIMGSLIIGVPTMVISGRFYPDNSVKGTSFIVCSTLFILLVVLAWPVTIFLEASYFYVFLLCPYAFCSAACLAYLVYCK